MGSLRFSRTSSGFAYSKAYALRLPHSSDSQINLLRHSEDQTCTSRYWNINQLCIDYSLRPRLSSRLTPGGRTLPGKPYPYGDPDSNRVYRYSSPDSHFPKVHRRSRFGFIPAGTLSYRSSIGRTHIFGAMLSPDHLRRRFTRWVSYYALFKWWLPLSQHPHCLCKSTSFST